MTQQAEQLTPSTREAVRTLARRAKAETWTTSKAAPLYVSVGGRIVAMSWDDWLVLDEKTMRLSIVSNDSVVMKEA